MKSTYFFRWAPFLLLTLLLTACYEDDSCNQNTVTGVNILVANSGDDASTDLDGLNHKNIESWHFTALDDTLPFVSSDNQTYSSGIPLDIDDTTITFLFKIRDNDTTSYLKDTIVFNYVQTDLKLLSINCGFAPLFKLTGCHSTENVLDSVMVYDDVVTTDLEISNVTFYY